MSLDRTQEFLSFSLGGLEYGLDIRQVRDLCLLDALEGFGGDARATAARGDAGGAAPVPGVARARGVIMPIVDMRAAFAGAAPAQRTSSDVIVLTLSHCVMGMVVERVNGVVSLAPGQVKAVPAVDGAAPPDYLLGLADCGARRLILVDIDRLMQVGTERVPLAV